MKVQAFRLPVAQGKTDLVEAFEKDYYDPSFKNLSQLFKDNEKKKLETKSMSVANDILKRFKPKKAGRAGVKTKRSVENLPLEIDQEQKIVNLHFREVATGEEDDDTKEDTSFQEGAASVPNFVSTLNKDIQML